MVLSSDGFVEVFGGREVDCHVAQRLAVDSIEAERMAEEFLDGTLPKRFRELFLPGMLRRPGLSSGLRRKRRIDTLWQLEILKGLRELRAEKAPPPVPDAIARRRAAT